jgi:hypothetical protein
MIANDLSPDEIHASPATAYKPISGIKPAKHKTQKLTIDYVNTKCNSGFK